MKWIILGALLALGPMPLGAQENGASTLVGKLLLDPVVVGFRYDDNVLRSVSSSNRLADGIYSLNLGGTGTLEVGRLRMEGVYQLGDDQYQTYADQNNFRNNLNLSIGWDPDDLSFSFKKTWFWRFSGESNYDYFEDGNYLDMAWLPRGPWGLFGVFHDYSRYYYDASDTFRSRNYLDQSAGFSIQREVNEQLSFKLEGGYNVRQFNRTSIQVNGPVTMTSPDFPLQNDRTWSIRAIGHLYVESVLQDFQLEHQRTDSNSYGFANTVDSISWAAILKPASSLYLQLFFRLYSKKYDTPPILGNPDLQIGYVDEDSQDLLSIKTSWEWAPQWSLNLGISRFRTESAQPSLFYIKDIFSVELQKDF